jgi:hypothetical protein
MERNPVSFLKRAKECRQLARHLKTPGHRLTLLHMAERWEQLARQNGIPVQRIPPPPPAPAWPKNE